jgi:proline racemase
MDNLDHIRKVLLLEPRGYPCQNANIIVPSTLPEAEFGFIILEQNKIYPVSRKSLARVARVPGWYWT